MKKNSAIDFYLKVIAWIFFCLSLAGIHNHIKINSRAVVNESAAAQTIQTLCILQTQFAQKHRGKYASTFGELIKTGALDEKFDGQNPLVNGYVFEMKVTEPTSETPPFYSITADPLVSEGFIFNKTGEFHFYYDSTLGVVKVTEQNRQANPDDASF
ncbi:MAG TPA: hypothetical protein VGC97_12930 [Pyrinomonadaceae bacterium]|jgi:hypothetical protein